jgi:SAM-dependent methyltransferase
VSATPFPPLELANRVGSLETASDPFEYFDDLGRGARDDIVSLLPTDWSFEGKRVLDFGCGAGRTLRHFLDEAQVSEFWACDIDRPSVDWLREHLSPPFHAFANDERPPLDRPDRYFDLVYCVSVFTHLTAHWSRWLAELHRVLADDGLLIATFMGRGLSELIAGERWEEDRVGMNVLKPGQSWDDGGPMVLHSPWWIRAHWGRAFDVVELREDGFCDGDGGASQGIVLMRKRAVEVRPQDLERPEPGEARESSALAHNLEQVARELAGLRGEYDKLAAAWQGEKARREHAERVLDSLAGSRSWRLTAPLRRIRALRRRDGSLQ